jgi:signal transduction histidine kinase
MDPEFLQALLHDLKGPVGRVRMLGELLVQRNSGLDDQSKLLISHIEKSASAADAVLEALRRYMDVTVLSFHPERFKLSLSVEAAMRRLENQLQRSAAAVTYTGLPEILGDHTQLTILFQELVANSIRFRSEAPLAIAIAATAEDSGWTITYSDNGAGLGGMDPERIFRPFATSTGPRPGIGLAICRHIAKLHNADITARPGPQGLEFRLRLSE